LAWRLSACLGEKLFLSVSDLYQTRPHGCGGPRRTRATWRLRLLSAWWPKRRRISWWQVGEQDGADNVDGPLRRTL